MLLAAYSRAHFRELFRLAELLDKSPGFSCTFYFGRRYELIDLDLDSCRNLGFGILPESVEEPERRTTEGEFATQTKAVWRWLPSGAKELLKAIAYRRDYRRRLESLDAMVGAHGADVIVLPEDNVASDTSLLIRAGHRNGIPSLIVPFTIAGPLEALEALWDVREHQMDYRLNRVIGWLFPEWVRCHRGRRLLRLPGCRVLSQKLSGFAPSDPWVPNDGCADAIAVESKRLLACNLNCGLKPGRMRITGTPVDDVLADGLRKREALRAQTMNDYGLDPTRRVIVSALPPNQLIGFGRPVCEFKSYDALVAFWVATLRAAEGFNTILCPHPRVNPQEYRHLESDTVRISRSEAAREIPICDLYVASISSTIRWAVACGKPVINYDVYLYRYDDFETPGTVTVESREAFQSAVQQMTGEPDALLELTKKQQGVMGEWANLDGKAVSRLEALIRELATCRE